MVRRVAVAVTALIGAFAACGGDVATSSIADQDASDSASGSCAPGAHCPATCDGGIGQSNCPQYDAGESGPRVDAARVCAPGDVASFVPTYHRATPHQGACSQSQMDSFFWSCLEQQAPPGVCNRFLAGGDLETCGACLLSEEAAPTWGPVIHHKGLASLNIAGCMELLDPVNGLECAKAYDASEQCNDAACAANCPVTDDASLQLYEACIQQAASGGCKAFTDAAKCADAEADGGPAAICLVGQTFQDLYNSIAPLFCLAASDGGTDAGD